MFKDKSSPKLKTQGTHLNLFKSLLQLYEFLDLVMKIYNENSKK